jgi:hypothetical protein
VKNRIKTLLPLPDEKQKRIYLATAAAGLGYGGLKVTRTVRTNATSSPTPRPNSSTFRPRKARKNAARSECAVFIRANSRNSMTFFVYHRIKRMERTHAVRSEHAL